jgi:membrane associated rhomboid family serine protease
MCNAASRVLKSSSERSSLGGSDFLCCLSQMPANRALVSNFSRNCRNLRHSPASAAMVAGLFAIHLAVVLAGGPQARAVFRIYELLGLSRDGVLSGWLWQIFSYGLLHGSVWHVGFNGLFVLLMGSRIEHIAGRAVVVRAAGLGVIGGGIAHLLLADGRHGAPILVGFSGGCMALLLLMTTLSPQSRMMPLPITAKALGLGVLAAALLLSLINPALGLPVFSKMGTQLIGCGLGSWFEMGHACHFGGGLAGWLYARWLLRGRVTLERLRAARSRREAL